MTPSTGSRSAADARPVIATVIGDPAGIGPEVCVKALATGVAHECSRPLLIGSVATVRDAITCCGLGLKARAIDDVGDAAFVGDTIDVLDLRNLGREDYIIGQACAASGHAVRSWLDFATTLAQQRKVAGWIMAHTATNTA
jgi:4-phospho-D-threonate 3-dehydrogenase / 4-phospho-D-erythronate 3-dehydrogenase